MLRWALRLQEFEYEVVHRPGKLNPLYDGLKSTEPYGEEAVESLYAVGTRASAKARTTGEAKKPRISKKRPPETALPDQNSTKLSKQIHKTADNTIAEAEESRKAVEKQAKQDHKNQESLKEARR